MSRIDTQSGFAAPSSRGGAHEDPLDPANQSLAEALRKSFRILKLLMLVLVVLYFLSGWFSVKQDEVGVITRFGRIAGVSGDAKGDAVKRSGWHWSWPYPFERWITVPTKERELPVDFLFLLSEAEQATGIGGYKYDNLSPLRDDYLITGDVNILHASLIIKYKITDAIAYLTNVMPMPDAKATVRSKDYLRYPEYTVLRHLARNAVIEAAARKEALDVRGSRQEEFLASVGMLLHEKLKTLELAGTPLGISLDPSTGVIAPKTGGTVEAIMPPRQTQEIFDRVFAAQTEKSVAITKATSEAQGRLLQTAGPDYQILADAIDKEFQTLLAVSASRNGDKTQAAATETLTAQAARHAEEVEKLLNASSGEAQAIVKGAQIGRDRIVKETAADYDQFQRLLPEFLRNPEVFMSRLRDDSFSQALDNKNIAKVFVPAGSGGRFRLNIPRSTPKVETGSTNAPSTKENEARQRGKGGSIRSAPRPIMPQ